MEMNRLGNTSIEVPTLGFGCWAIAGGMNWGPQEESASLEAIHAAVDHGLTLFDTAEGYGDGYSEELLGKGLGDRRDAVLLASKVSGPNLAPDDVRTACEKSLQRLKTDRIDLYQIHWPNPDVPMGDTVGAMEMLVEAGKIRAYGICNFGPEQLKAYLEAGGMRTSNQVAYNLVFRASEFAVLPATWEAGMGLLAYSPIMQGMLTDRYESLDAMPLDRHRTRHFSSTREYASHGGEGYEALTQITIDKIRGIAKSVGRPTAEIAMRWLLDRAKVTTVLIGGRNAKQVARNAKAGSGPLSQDVLDALDSATKPLKTAMGENTDLWETESRIY